MRKFETFLNDLLKNSRPIPNTANPEDLNKSLRNPRERDKYEPFSGENKACPKCGSSTIACTYRPSGTFFEDEMFYLGVSSDEWMLRTCNTCHYEWPEECPNYPLPD